MRWFLTLLCALAAAPADAAVLRDDHSAIREALPTFGLEVVSKRRAVPLPEAQSLCRRGGEELEANGSLSVLAARPACTARVQTVTSQRLAFTRRGAGHLTDPFGFGGMGAPVLPLGRARSDTATETERDGEETEGLPAAAGLTLPPTSLTALALPALKSAPASLGGAAAAPTPVPSAAWLFASGVTVLILRRRRSDETRGLS